MLYINRRTEDGAIMSWCDQPDRIILHTGEEILELETDGIEITQAAKEYLGGVEAWEIQTIFISPEGEISAIEFPPEEPPEDLNDTTV